MTELPPGFVLDNDASALPDGFTLDQPSNSLAGSAKAVGSGLANLAFHTAGTMGDIRNIGASAIGSIAKMAGLPEDRVDTAVKAVSNSSFPGPSTQQIRGPIENLTGSLDYKPQTSTEGYLKTGAEFLPGLASPGSIPRKIAQTVIPAAASETAGQLTEGTAAEPYARIAAGVAGGLVSGARSPRVPEAPVPSAAELRVSAQRSGYEHPDVQNLQLRQPSVERLVDNIQSDLNRRGFLDVPNGATGAHAAIDRLRNPTNAATPGLPAGVVSAPELQSTRSALSHMTTEVLPNGRPSPNATAAGRAIRQIDAYLENVPASDVFAGNAQRAAQRIREANRDWAAQAKSEAINLQQIKADRQAGRSGSGSNIENSMRQKIDSIFSPGRPTGAGLTQQERALADQIVTGNGTVRSNTRNVLRKVGKLGFGDGLSILLHTAATIPSLGLNLPVGIAGTVARKVGEGMTRRDIARLDEMIRSRSAEAERWRAIQARINSANPRTGILAAPQRGLLGGALSAGGILSRLAP